MSPANDRKRVWSLELVLVIAIPLLTVVAGVVTFMLAHRDGYTPTVEQVDRFGRERSQDEP